MSWLRALVLSLSCSGAFGCAPLISADPLQQTDLWSQGSNDRADILFVIDDSGTTLEEQARLVQSLPSFVAPLQEAQTAFHIGVVTTSLVDGPSLAEELPFLTPEDDYLALLPDLIGVGASGSDKEKGLWAARSAMRLSAEIDGGFSREDARLSIVFVSDEDDCSDAGALDDRAPATCYTSPDLLVPVEEIVSDLRAVKRGDADLLEISAIVGFSSCGDVYPGGRYLDAVARTGGTPCNLCDIDWDGAASELGRQASGIRSRFRLSRAAQPGTLEVSVDGQPVAEDGESGFTYDEETWFLEFHGASVPARGAEIAVTYTVDPGERSPN